MTAQRAQNGGTEQPLVSIIVPTVGGRQRFLETALHSVAAQTHDAIELVVVDDSPSGRNLRSHLFDNTAIDFRDALADVRYLETDGHDTAGAARNTGLQAATGEYIAFLDDDDAWVETKLERQLAIFESDEEIGLVYCPQQYVDEDGSPIAEGNPTVEGDVVKDILVGRPFPPFSTVVVRAEVVDAVGLIDERLPVLEDREWFLRIATRFQVGRIDDALTRRRRGEYDHTSEDWEGLLEQTCPVLLEEYRPLAAEYGWLTERRFVAWLYLVVGMTGIKAGHFRDARKYCVRSMLMYPLAVKPYVLLALTFGGEWMRDPVVRLRRKLARMRG